MTAVYGYQAQWGADTIAVVTHRFDFQSSGLGVDENMIDTDGLRGTRSRAIERIRQGNRRIAGQVVFEPTSLELGLLLPWILGGTPTGATTATVTYPLADTLPTRYVVVDKGAKVCTYNGCVVNRATIHGSQGEPLRLTLDVVGIDETVANSGTFPSLNLDISTFPLIFTDLSLTINGSVTQTRDIDITIDNVVDTNRFFNSQTVTALIPMDRHITMSTNLPYGDASALYNLGASGTSCTATFQYGNEVLTLVAGKAVFPRKPIPVPGRQEIMMPFPGTFYKTGSTLELITTLAQTP